MIMKSAMKFVIIIILSENVFIDEIFVADRINSVGDYNSSPGGCCVCVCVCVSPPFFHVSRLDNF